MKNKKEPKIITKLAPKVNMIYALSIIGEGLCVDLGFEESLKPTFEKFRKSVNETSGEEIAEAFGNWTDHVEEHLKFICGDMNLLGVIMETMYNMSKSMEQTFRMIDPRFDFYDMDSVKKLYKLSAYFPQKNGTYLKVNEKIKQLMKV